MAIDFGRLQMSLSPLAPINVGGMGQLGMERQRLQLMREQFENQKRQQEEENRLRQEAEAGQMARARMAGEREQAKAQAKAAAKLQEQKLALHQKFTEAAGSGNIEAAHAMVPIMTELGMGVDLEGEEHGLPRYRVTMDAKQAAAEDAQRQAQAAPYGEGETAEQSLSRLGAMGLEGETGNLDDLQSPERSAPGLELTPGEGERDASVEDALTPGDADIATAGQYGGEGTADVDVGGGGMQPAALPGSDAYAQALAASRHAEVTGEPMRKPDEADYTGGVPKDVIDTGALHEQTLARLNPALKALVAAHPEDYRDSAQATADAVVASGLPAAKALEEFRQQRSGPNDLIKAQLESGAKTLKGEQPDYMQRAQLRKTGIDEAQQTAQVFDGLKDYTLNQNTYAVAKDILTNDDNIDDSMIGELIGRRMGQRGTSTEGDIQRIFGTASMSWLELIKNKAWKAAFGGLDSGQKQALLGVVQKWEAEDKANAFKYLDTIDETANQEEPHFSHGLRTGAGLIVPRAVRDEWQEARKKKWDPSADAGSPRAAGAPVTPGTGAGDEQLKAAGLDPAKLRRVIGPESGGDPKATSSEGASGTMQIMPDNLKAMGIEPEDFKKLSASEQMAYNIRYLKDRGITADSSADDYAMAVAAPDPKFRNASDDTVIYKKGSKQWEANKPWRPADGGDITKGSILAFYGLRGGSADADKTKAESKPKAPDKAETKLTNAIKSADERARQLLGEL